MLPKSALKALDSVAPKLNPILAKGLAVHHMQHAEAYIDSVFKSVAASFPPGFKYLGCRRCDPLQEYAEISRVKNGKMVFDVARSDIYLMEYRFQFNDEPVISRYIYLPFVGQAGTIYLSGSRFVISPILADKVISVGLNDVFVRVLKSKLTFNRISHHYKADGRVENIQVAWSKIYNKTSKSGQPKATTSAKSSLMHYLLCKHGFHRTFELYTKCKPVVGGDDITEERYPKKDWVICESTQMQPKNYKGVYFGTTIKVAIRREEYTDDIMNLIAGFYYIVDHFPTYIRPEDVDQVGIWRVLMGHVIWSGNVGANRLFSDVGDHIASLDDYLDAIYASKLKDAGYPCNDIYALFYTIIKHFNDWLMTADDRVCTMYDKELAVLPFVLSEIVSGINNFYFNLNAAKKKELTGKKITTLMNLYLRQGMVFKLAKEHGEVSTQGTSGDNMALKITNLLVPQHKSSKTGKQKARTVLSDPTKRLHVSIGEVGGAWAIPKAEPDGRSRLSLTLEIDPTGLVLRDPKYVDLLDSIQQKIKRQ